MSKIKFNPEISFGHLLTILSMLGTVVAGYIAHDRKIVKHEEQIVTLQKTDDTHTKMIEKLTKLEFETKSLLDSLAKEKKKEN